MNNVVGPAADATDLVSALGRFIPPSVKSSHVIFGAGIALAGVLGTAFAIRSLKPEPVEKMIVKMIRPILPKTSRQKYKAKDSAIEKPKLYVDFNETDGVVILHNWPRGRITPCISPFPFKLETFLRVYGIKYEVDFENNGPREGIPWITVGVEDIIDSQNCIRFLCHKYKINMDRKIDPFLESQGRAYLHLMEHHLYWGISLHRWVYGEAKDLREIQFLPLDIEMSVPDICKNVERAAWFHGMGKMTSHNVAAEVLVDLDSLSELLGDKKYMLSDQYPSELDCTAFGMLAQIIWNMDYSLYYHAIEDMYPNLEAFCWRMRKAFWPDWDKCLNDIPFFVRPMETDDSVPLPDNFFHYA